MSKVVLFSTRRILEENDLFGKKCQSLVSKDGKEFSPLVDYFRACDTENELFGKYKDSNKRIKDFLAKNNKWDSEFEGKPMKDVIPKVLPKLNEDENNELNILTKERNESTSKASPGFDYEKFWNDVLSNTDHLIGLDIDKNQATLKDRFSIYVLGNNAEEALKKDCVFMAIWPLGRTETKEENNYNIWISTLVEQICKLVENCEEITLLLHDKDICNSPHPFQIIIPQRNYPDDQGQIALTVAIFQHTPVDPINDILTKPETDLPKLNNNISLLLSKFPDMMEAGNAHITRKIYQDMVKLLENKNQAK